MSLARVKEKEKEKVETQPNDHDLRQRSGSKGAGLSGSTKVILQNFPQVCLHQFAAKIQKRLEFLIRDLQFDGEELNRDSFISFIHFLNRYTQSNYPDIMVDNKNLIHCEWKIPSQKAVVVLVFQKDQLAKYLVKKEDKKQVLYSGGTQDFHHISQILTIDSEIAQCFR